MVFKKKDAAFFRQQQELPSTTYIVHCNLITYSNQNGLSNRGGHIEVKLPGRHGTVS